jgi:subfamily B ATP-binding cassette protein MsbA
VSRAPASVPARDPNAHSIDVAEARNVYARLLRYAKPYWRLYLIGLIGTAMFASADLLTVWFAKTFLQDALALAKHPVLFDWLPLAVIGIFLVRGLGDYLANYFPARAGRYVIKVVRGKLFEHYLALPTAQYDRDSSAAMLSRLTYNAEMVASAATDSLVTIVRDSLTIIADITVVFYLNWRLASWAIIVVPGIALLVRSLNARFRAHGTRIQNSIGDVTRVAKEALDAHRVVKVFNAQRHIGRLFDEANEQNRRSNVRLLSARASSGPIVQMVQVVGLALVILVAKQEIERGSLTIPLFLPFVIALMQVTQPLRRLLNVTGPMQQGIAAGASLFRVLDSPTEPLGGQRVMSRAHGEVEFRDVSFEYVLEKGAVLRHINLKVPAGSTMAIVGRSGSGKSTLVSLLPRFYDPTAGSILLDGVDIREYPMMELRRQMSFVSQEVVLFNETIRNNILFGLENVSEARMEAAVRAAYVHEFVQQLPQGLETMVGDRGVLLSGGQRQRIAIARALLRDTPILILDEATSALDTAAERHIQAALDRLVMDRTTFVIAHRLSTVERADCILVMSDGAIAQMGTHAELLAAGGAYAELYRMQFSA